MTTLKQWVRSKTKYVPIASAVLVILVSALGVVGTRVFSRKLPATKSTESTLSAKYPDTSLSTLNESLKSIHNALDSPRSEMAVSLAASGLTAGCNGTVGADGHMSWDGNCLWFDYLGLPYVDPWKIPTNQP